MIGGWDFSTMPAWDLETIADAVPPATTHYVCRFFRPLFGSMFRYVLLSIWLS
jgi:hypothetical protein